jgi:hypothetical protein
MMLACLSFAFILFIEKPSNINSQNCSNRLHHTSSGVERKSESLVAQVYFSEKLSSEQFRYVETMEGL